VKIQIDAGAFEQAMLIPVGLADSQHVTRRFQRWNVRPLIGRVRDHEENVDDRLGDESGY